jgi:hypothetical protein
MVTAGQPVLSLFLSLLAIYCICICGPYAPCICGPYAPVSPCLLCLVTRSSSTWSCRIVYAPLTQCFMSTISLSKLSSLLRKNTNDLTALKASWIQCECESIKEAKNKRSKANGSEAKGSEAKGSEAKGSEAKGSDAKLWRGLKQWWNDLQELCINDLPLYQVFIDLYKGGSYERGVV